MNPADIHRDGPTEDIEENCMPEPEEFCCNCGRWEPDKSGLRPYRRGFCPVFQKYTDAIHGWNCTAFLASSTRKPNPSPNSP